MIVSPSSNMPSSLSIVSSVGLPAGTMIHTARGGVSLETRSSSESDPLAPCSSAALTASAQKSKATTSMSESRRMRVTMLPPILPSPMKPICISVYLRGSDRACLSGHSARSRTWWLPGAPECHCLAAFSIPARRRSMASMNWVTPSASSSSVISVMSIPALASASRSSEGSF